MSAGIVNFTGNVTKDPIITCKNKKKASFTVAVNRKEGECMYYKVTAWDYDAEKVEKYCKKGYELTVSGEFWPNTYIDKNNVSRVSYEVTANNIQFRRRSKLNIKSSDDTTATENMKTISRNTKTDKKKKEEKNYSPIEESDLANGDFGEYF